VTDQSSPKLGSIRNSALLQLTIVYACGSSLDVHPRPAKSPP
jgi:hypothetical protein